MSEGLGGWELTVDGGLLTLFQRSRNGGGGEEGSNCGESELHVDDVWWCFGVELT